MSNLYNGNQYSNLFSPITGDKHLQSSQQSAEAYAEQSALSSEAYAIEMARNVAKYQVCIWLYSVHTTT